MPQEHEHDRGDDHADDEPDDLEPLGEVEEEP